ncbi:MAG: FHA domain-containing protein [Leptolyngbyaceae cyanobacterium RU_5_1]|nr:FHA domain-containing protein [Leptolyngbyaceae cyanobacterium RU_5_1]
MLRHLAALLVAPTLIPAQIAFSQDSQADSKQQTGSYSKPALVRVVAGCSGIYSYGSLDYPFTVGEVGSGYFISADGYVVTDQRLLSPAESAGCQDYLFRYIAERVAGTKNVNGLSEATRIDIRNRSQTMRGVSYFSRVILPTGDLFPFEIARLGIPEDGLGHNVAVIKIQVTNAPTLQLGNSSTLKPQDPATIAAYPIEGNLQAFFSKFFSGDAPSSESLGRTTIIDGQISNAKGRLALQLQGSLPSGSSGGAVLNQNGEAIGMISPANTDSAQGSSVSLAIPSNTIRSLAGQIKGINQVSITDRLYREGLDLLQQKKFEQAKAKFEQVKKLYPYHSDAILLSYETDQLIAQGEGQRGKTLWLIGTAVISGGLLIAYAIYFLVERRRYQQANQLAAAQPVAYPLNMRKSTPQPPAPELPETSVKPDSSIEPPKPRQTVAATQIGGRGFSPATVVGTQPFVELKNQDGQVRRFYLNKDRHRLGHRDCRDLNVPDNGWEVISRHHAILEREGTDYRIYDGDRRSLSTNGIFLDGVPIHTKEGHLLKDGDRLQTGQDSRNQVILTYTNPGGRQSNQPDTQISFNEGQDTQISFNDGRQNE